MADTQVGTGVIQGITNDGSTMTITGFATFLMQDMEAEEQFDLSTGKDAGGFDANLSAVNERIEQTIDFIIAGPTRAAAAATAVFIAPLAKITIAHHKIAAFNGDWIYMGGQKISVNNVNQGRINGLKIRRYTDATQNTSLTTTVSG